MSDLTVYALKSCDSCRKALSELRAAGREPEVIDIRADGVPRALLDRLVRELGAEVLVNRRSTTWRGLDQATRDRALDAATTAQVLAEHPTLMKRPVVVAGDRPHVGWSPAIRAALAGLSDR